MKRSEIFGVCFFVHLSAGDELDGAFASDEVVVNDTREGQHGKAAVLDLGQFKARAVVALAQANGVEAEVSRLAARTLSDWREGGREGGRGRREGGKGGRGGKKGEGGRQRNQQPTKCLETR